LVLDFVPRSFLHALLSCEGGPGDTKINREGSVNDLDEHEVAIYLMEHNDVDDVTVSVDGRTPKAKGIVFFSGRPSPFSIAFTEP